MVCKCMIISSLISLFQRTLRNHDSYSHFTVKGVGVLGTFKLEDSLLKETLIIL